MDSSSLVPSSIKALNAGISSHNPFVDAGTVREPEVWIDRQADSSQLNVGTRSHLYAAYGRICRGETVAAVTLLGQTGTGKTHELNRLRQHVHTAPTPGLFVYLNVQQFSEGQAVRQQFLRAIGDSFVRRMPSGLLQWQQLAIALANHALSGIDNTRKQFAPRSVLDLLSRNSLEQNQAWIDRIAEAFFRVRPDIDDPDLVRAIFWTLCPHQLPYARKWLSGLIIPSWKRNELGLPQPRTHNPESQAWQMTLNLLAAIEHYAPVTIAFDCFEHPEIPDPGVQKERVAVGLIKWLGDRLRTRTRRFGVLFVSAMHPDTWDLVEDHFGPVAQFAHDGGEPCGLQPADAETIEQAIECWLQTFYHARNLVPPTPLYPFDRAQVAALVRESVDLHDAIDWCADNFQPVETDPLEPVELRFGAIVRELANDGLGDDWAVSQAIGQAFAQLKGCDLTIDDPIPPSDQEESGGASISEISFRVHDVVLHPQLRTFPITIELEILDVTMPDRQLDPEPSVVAPAGAETTGETMSEMTSEMALDLTEAEFDPASSLETQAQSGLPPETINDSEDLPLSESSLDTAVSTAQTTAIASPPAAAHILRIGLGALTSENGRQLCAQIDRCWEAIQSAPEDAQAAATGHPFWVLGCLVRPLGATIPAHWKAAQSFARFAQHDRGMTIEFSLDDIAPLLALMRLDAEIGDRERVAAMPRPVTPMEASDTTDRGADSGDSDPHDPNGVIQNAIATSQPTEHSETDGDRSTPTSATPINSSSSVEDGEVAIGSSYDRDVSLEPAPFDHSSGSDPGSDPGNASANENANENANEIATNPAAQEIAKDINSDSQGEGETDRTPQDQPKDQPIVDADSPSPNPDDHPSLPVAFSNHRLSRFPSAKPIRDRAITRELLAAWIDRENIAIDNVIVCTLIGRAVADLLRRDHPILKLLRQSDTAP
jgi:hypothetical protein